MHNFYCPNPECSENKNPKEKSFIKSGTYKRINIRNRLKQLHYYCNLRMAKETEEIKLEEPLVFDGFESFSESQYFPFHLQHLVGKDSNFIYDFNLVLLNRKGKMTEAEQIFEKAYKLHQSGALQERKMKLITDEHPAYQRALKKLQLNDSKVEHIQVNSKIKRDVHNKLFPVNSLDSQLRHFLCCFKRETIAFCKRPLASLAKACIFYFHKNFMRPIFYKKRPGRNLHEISPAMKVGLMNEFLSFEKLASFVDRRAKALINEGWQMI